MAIVEVLGYTGVETPSDIFGASIRAWVDFTDSDYLTLSGGKIQRFDDKNGGTVYGLAQGTWATYIQNPDNGLYCYDPRQGSASGSWFRTYNLPSSGSNTTIIFIGKRVSTGSQIVGTHGDTADTDGLHFNSTYYYARERSGTDFYYTPATIANDALFCGGFWAKDGNGSVNNWDAFENGTELSGDAVSGGGYYNSYNLSALGNGRNGAGSSYRTPLMHEVIYVAGSVSAANWTRLMDNYVGPKYGI